MEIISVIVMLALAGLSGWYATKKGYNFWPWFLGGSLISIIIMLFLPNENDMAEDKKAQLLNRGNTIGWCLFAVLFTWGFVQGFLGSK
jgi:4-hydroxybenzoate polyprenyltransferase